MLYENTVAPATLGLLKELMLNRYSLEQMLQFFADKYAITDIGFVVRSLAYFEEADNSRDAVMLNKMTWKQAKLKIQMAVKRFWRG